MLKIATKIALIGSLLAMTHAHRAQAHGYGFDFRPTLVATTLGGIVAGGAGMFALTKAYAWARHEHGAKKYVGRSVLGITGISALVGLGYAVGYVTNH